MFNKPDKILLLKSLLFPVIFTMLLWAIKAAELLFNIDFIWLGVYPLRVSGLIGIIAAPLIHNDLHHLISNTFGIFLLSWGIFYFYPKVAKGAILIIYILSGFWVWFFAREAYHIGASGLIYGMAAFLFFSGILRKHAPLVAVSMTIVFIYGGIIWGIFPTFEYISWETHLTGFVAGIIAAVYYKNEEPKKPQPFIDSENENDIDYMYNGEDESIKDNITPENPKSDNNIEINYHYKKTDNLEKS